MQDIRETVIHSFARVNARRAYESDPTTVLMVARRHLETMRGAQIALAMLGAPLATTLIWYAKADHVTEIQAILEREVSASLTILAALQRGLIDVLYWGREDQVPADPAPIETCSNPIHVSDKGGLGYVW